VYSYFKLQLEELRDANQDKTLGSCYFNMSIADEDTQSIKDFMTFNDTLLERLHTMKTYIDSAEADGWLGEDDPLLLTFRNTLSLHEKKVIMYSSFVNNLECQAPPAGMRAPGRGSLGLRTTRALGISLKEEVKAMKLEVVAMDRSFKMMKKRTESSEKYVEFRESLSKGNTSVIAETKSDVMVKIDDMVPRIATRSLYMGDLFSTLPLIPEASIVREFNALRMEVDYLCLRFWSPKVDELMKQILQGLAGMARRFAVVINKYYAKELGKDFAELASARFRATYILIRGVSSLCRGSIILEKPLVMLLRRSDFASDANMIVQNLRLLNTPDIQRQFARMAFGRNLKLITTMCSDFLNNTQEVLQSMISSTETIDRRLCDGGEIKSLDLPAYVVTMLEQDDEDAEFLQNTHRSTSLREIPPDLEVQAHEIVPKLKSFGLREMQLPCNEAEQIDYGSFASVRVVPWKHSNLCVAIKCYKVVNNEQRTMKRLVREAQIMSELRHTNVLSVFGYAQLPTQSHDESNTNVHLITYALVYPIYRNGSLRKKYRKFSLSEYVNAKILLDVATALAYLHDPAKKVGIVIHGDLRAANILITPTGRALLCDFGLSTHSNIDQKWRTLSRKTHSAWLAYEFYDVKPPGEVQELTVKTDIFAFGCICYEVIHRNYPYHDCDYNQIAARKVRLIPPTIDIPTTYRAQDHFKQLMEICWRVKPSQRPPASRLVSILKALSEALL